MTAPAPAPIPDGTVRVTWHDTTRPVLTLAFAQIDWWRKESWGLSVRMKNGTMFLYPWTEIQELKFDVNTAAYITAMEQRAREGSGVEEIRDKCVQCNYRDEAANVIRIVARPIGAE